MEKFKDIKMQSMKCKKIMICWLLLVVATNGLHSFVAADKEYASAISKTDYKKEVLKTLRKQILREADWALQQQPVTVTAQSSSRSAGGKHDFFSEGDYWWPNP